ncbi:MAG: hypothetical protein IPO45_02050 [Saprospiraceae bacterium]|nr:hypothetical protein [Candidatus Brachybacter algidus]
MADSGPKLQGKIYIWMGDMDHFYLNPAKGVLDEYLKTTKNPVLMQTSIFLRWKAIVLSILFEMSWRKSIRKIKDSNFKIKQTINKTHET